MLTGSQIRQNMLLMLTGGALVAGGMMMSHRPEAVAVSPLPKADELSSAFRQIAVDAIPSIVSIECVTNAKKVQGNGPSSPLDEDSPFRQFFRNDPQLEELFKNRSPRGMTTPQRKAMGSGFIIDANGTILTNGHVVRGADEVKVRLHDGREFIARDVKSDARTDVAIIRIDASDLKPIQMGDSHQVQVGDWVLAIGSPFGLDTSVTAGIISAKGRSGRITERADFLQTDAAINPGNSGGPLIDMSGRVVGINTAIASNSGGNEGIGFSIPSNLVARVVDQLLEYGKVYRAYLGVKLDPEFDITKARALKLDRARGARVLSIYPNTPAARAKLQKDDVILSFDGIDIHDENHLINVVSLSPVGKKVRLTVMRRGEKMTVQVDLSDRSVAEDDSPPSPTQPQQSKTDTKVELMSLPSERSQPANSFDLKFEISDLKFQMTIHRTP